MAMAPSSVVSRTRSVEMPSTPKWYQTPMPGIQGVHDPTIEQVRRCGDDAAHAPRDPVDAQARPHLAVAAVDHVSVHRVERAPTAQGHSAYEQPVVDLVHVVLPGQQPIERPRHA